MKYGHESRWSIELRVTFKRWLIGLGLLGAILVLVGCSEEKSKGKTDSSFTLSVQKLYDYGEMASTVYGDESTVNDYFANRGYETVKNAVLSDAQVRYVYLRDDDAQEQFIVIRGTDNPDNVFTDIDGIPFFESGIGWLHKGFRKASLELFQTLQDQALLQKNYGTTVIGHSLGGAMAGILGAFLYESDHRLNHIVTFGQPKFTNGEGADKYDILPLIRVVGSGDTVAAVPPNTSVINYSHTGLKLSLGGSTLTHAKVGDKSNQEDDTSSTDLSNIGNHSMAVYLSRLSPHVSDTLTISFKSGSNWESKK